MILKIIFLVKEINSIARIFKFNIQCRLDAQKTLRLRSVHSDCLSG
jgi:hypothetical protein